MRSRFFIAATAAAVASIASPVNALENTCLATINVVGLTIQGWHDITVDTPTYNDWDYYVRLRKNNVVKDSGTYHDPNQSPQFTSTGKQNCVWYRAETEADFRSPNHAAMRCEYKADLKTDTVPPSC
jgi:hypothetical protein